MFRYNPDTQTYSMSLFEDSVPEGGFSKMDEKQKQLQEVALRSTFKIITEPEFHDLWFCETRDCENSFWLGGRHHCRMCGITVCEEHCHTNVVLSTHLMPVIEDKLPNVTATILAASRLDASLPETLEFKRACLSCCEKAKHIPLKLWIENEKERLRKEQKEAEDRSRLSESHWTADEELTAKIQSMKAKKIAWCQTNSRRHKRASRGQPLYDSEGEEYFEGDVRPQKTLAQQIAERAEKRLQAARAAQEAALIANTERQAQLAAHSKLLHQQRAESMTPAEFALYQKQLERAQAEAEKNAIAHQVDSANEQMKAGMASVFFSIAKRSEIAAQKEELRAISDAAQVALSKSTRHIFDRLTLNKEFEKAKKSFDVDNMHRVAVALIGLAWQVKVDRRNRAALKLQREELLRKVSIGRIQAWWHVMLARLRAVRVQQLKQNLHETAQEILRVRILDLMSVNRMDGIRSIVFKLIGQVRMKLRLATLNRVLVVEGIVCSAPASSQHVLVHHQTGLTHLSSVHASGRGTLLHKSRTEGVYKSRSVGAAADGVIGEKCVLAQVTGKSVIGVTLVNTDSYSQTLIPLSSYPALLKGQTVTITKPFIETAICPVTNPTTHKSYLPSTNIPKSAKLNKKLTIVPSVRTFRMHLLPQAFTHTGRVQKQANSVIGEFKSRFLVLAGGKLLYYEDSGVLHKPRSVMNCSDVSVFAFGPDRVPTGELTLYLSDSVQHWYLRFPKAIGTTGISEWLRKIQYSVGVSINNTNKSFIERIEQMSHVYTYPVLRPVDKGSDKKGVFEDSGVSNRNSVSRDSVGSVGAGGGRDSINRRNSTNSSKGIVFGTSSSASNKFSWGVFSMKRTSKPKDSIRSNVSSSGGGRTESVVHGHIGYTSDTTSGAYTPTTPAVNTEYADKHTTPLKSATTTFSTSTGKYKPPPSEEEKSSGCASPDSFARTPGTNNTTSTNNNGGDTFNTSTYGAFDTGSADHTLHLPWQQPAVDATNTTNTASAAEPKHYNANTICVADFSIEHKRSFVDNNTTTNNTTSSTSSSPRSPPAKPPKTRSFVASDNTMFILSSTTGGDEAVHGGAVTNTNDAATTTAANIVVTAADAAGVDVTTPTTPTTSATVNTDEGSAAVPISAASIDTPATITSTTVTTATNINVTPTTSPSYTARSITTSPSHTYISSTTTPNANNTSGTNLAFTLYQPRNNPLFMSPKRKSSGGMLLAGINGISSGSNAVASSGSVSVSSSGVDSAVVESSSGDRSATVGSGGDVVLIDSGAAHAPTTAAVDAAADSTDSAAIVTNSKTDAADSSTIIVTDTPATAALPLPAPHHPTREVETVEWSDSDDEHELGNMNINSAYSKLSATSTLRASPAPVVVSAVYTSTASTTTDADDIVVAITNATTTNTNNPSSSTDSPRVYAVPVPHSAAVSASLSAVNAAASVAVGQSVSGDSSDTINTSSPTSPISNSSADESSAQKTNKKKKKGGKK